jgi:hypothetical protein
MTIVDGESLRVGEYRSTKVNDYAVASKTYGKWGVLKVGAEYPTGQIFDTHQGAIDWMVHVECNKFSREER